MEALPNHSSVLHRGDQNRLECTGEEQYTRSRRWSRHGRERCRRGFGGEQRGRHGCVPLRIGLTRDGARAARFLVSFTGSEGVGRVVGKSVQSRFGKVLLELGGNNGEARPSFALHSQHSLFIFHIQPPS